MHSIIVCSRNNRILGPQLFEFYYSKINRSLMGTLKIFVLLYSSFALPNRYSEGIGAVLTKTDFGGIPFEITILRDFIRLSLIYCVGRTLE